MPAPRGKRRGALPGFYGRPLKRLKEIECLAHWRHRTGGYTDPVRALAVAGHALAALEGMRLRDRTRHVGLQYATAVGFLDRCDFDLTEQDVLEVIDGVSRSRCCERPFVMTDVEAGKLLDLTRDERTNLDIRTIEAMDEAPADRAARMAEWKRVNDRLRRRRATDTRRAEKGLAPVDRSGAKSPAPKPWEALGISKATYHRWKAKGQLGGETVVSRTYSDASTETAVSQTYSADDETAVSRSFRRNREVVRHHGLTSAQLEAHLLAFLGDGSVERGRRVAEYLDPHTVAAWIYLHRQGLLTSEQIELAEAAITAARAEADETSIRRGAA